MLVLKREFLVVFHLKQPHRPEQFEKLKNALQEINLVHPDDAVGAYISRVGQSRDRLILNIPNLNKSVKFSVIDDQEVIEKNIRFCNVAVSLRSCIVINSLYSDETNNGTYETLDIRFLVAKSDKSEQLKVLDEFYESLFDGEED